MEEFVISYHTPSDLNAMCSNVVSYLLSQKALSITKTLDSPFFVATISVTIYKLVLQETVNLPNTITDESKRIHKLETKQHN